MPALLVRMKEKSSRTLTILMIQPIVVATGFIHDFNQKEKIPSGSGTPDRGFANNEIPQKS